MALTATIHNFDIQLSDVDRNVYETLALRVARHPSETEEYLITRVLAYCLEYTEGIAFSRGIDSPEEPAITVKDLTGALKAWIEVGAPDADRLHKASKSSPRVALYTNRPPHTIQRLLAGARIHKSESLELFAFDKELLTALVDRLDRRVSMTVAISERQLYIDIGATSVSGAVNKFALE